MGRAVQRPSIDIYLDVGGHSISRCDGHIASPMMWGDSNDEECQRRLVFGVIAPFWSAIVSLLGISSVALVLLIAVKGDSYRGRGKRSYSETMRPYAYALICTYVLFCIGYLLMIDPEMVPGMAIGLLLVGGMCWFIYQWGRSRA